MPRTARILRADGYYHVLNRGNGGGRIFHADGDYAAFLRVLAEGLERFGVELLAYCLMPNHWHLVLRPRRDGRALSRLMQWLGVTHARRHHAAHRTRKGGHLYQGRFKCFPVQDDRHFLVLCRYVESNPLRAGLVRRRAENWRWSSLRARRDGRAREGGGTTVAAVIPGPVANRRKRTAAASRAAASGAADDDDPSSPLVLHPWPVDRPRDWSSLVNEAQPPSEVAHVRMSIARGRPLGNDAWTRRSAARLGLLPSLRPLGRPPKPADALSTRQLRRRRAQRAAAGPLRNVTRMPFG